MRLGKLSLAPFGAFSKKLLEFAPGLNVVLGPNEAGKSTVFNAVRLVLLTSTDLTKKERERLIGPYLPASGGDSIRVDLELHTGAEVWVMRRGWGATAFSKLELRGGGSFTDEETVREKLSALLPARPGTLEHVLMTRQSTLARTLETFRAEARDSVSDLSDILRKAVLETGGVSVDRFMEKVRTERDQAFLRWDRQAAGPEKSKGTQKRWTKGIGTVLAAWYALEKAREDQRKAAAWEAELDAVNAGLRQTGAAKDAQEAFIRTHEAAAKDAGERRALEAEKRAAVQKSRALTDVAKQWPVKAERIRQLQQSIANAEAARAGLEKERKAAQNAEEARTLHNRLARVLRRRTAVEEAQARLGALPRLEKKALAEIRTAAAVLSRLEAGLEAGRISVTVAGRAPGELLTQQDFSPEERQPIGPDRTLNLSGAGRIRIVHKDLEIEVRSGDADAQARAEKAVAARRTLTDLLRAAGAATVEAAEESSRQWEEGAADVRAAEKGLVEELNGEKLAELQARAAALAPTGSVRSIQEVAAELAASQAQAGAHARELTDLQREVGAWEAEHVSVEKLFESLAAAKTREAELDGRIVKAGALPPGFSEVDSFVQAFEKARDDVHRLSGELTGLEARKREMEKQPTDWGEQSAEELGVLVADAEEAFAAELRQAEALDRLAARSAGLLGSSDAAVTTGLAARLSETLSSMTAGRHTGIVMEGPLPVGLSETDGVSLSWDQLSAGTKDTLGLALRLAMAEYFLGNEDGFLMLDDPLVEMDPERQKSAAAALKSFAARRQLIVFTCHPSAATLLGGTLLRLSGSAAAPPAGSGPDPLVRSGSSRAAR